MIEKHTLDNLDNGLVEAFISLGTEKVRCWINDALSGVISNKTRRQIISYAIKYGLLSSQDTVKALHTDDIFSLSRYISALHIQKENGIQASSEVIQAIAEIAFSDTDNSVKAFTLLVKIDHKNKQRDQNIVKYKPEYRRFLKHEDIEMVMTAIAMLAELQDIQSFQTILDFAKYDLNTGIKIEAISELAKYSDIFPSEVIETLHSIYQTEKQENNTYIAGEALKSLAKVNINEVIPYYHDDGTEDILTYFCSTEGIILFNEYYIDRYGQRYSWHGIGIDTYPKLNLALDATTQLNKLRSVCIYLLNNGHAVKTGQYRRGHEPIPLFNKKTDTYANGIDSIDANTGKRLLAGKNLRNNSAKRLMEWLEVNFIWIFE